MRTIPVPVPEDTFERLRDLARDERRSAAAQALVLIERGLRRRITPPDAESVAASGAATRDARDGHRGAAPSERPQ
ncbi:MAG: ribbon-helix-helix domain-containing protein [Candidatus Limnocylindrales bacterium]